MPSPGNFGNQDKMDRPSSWSVTPTQHDGYLADSEENADLTLLQAQIQQARNNAKTIERRKNESQETMRRESIEKNAKDERIAATEDSTSQRPLENDSFDGTLLNGTEWDSDWDSDFSLHVKPLSDLSTSSGDESQWEPGNQTKPANNENADRTRKRSDKTVTNAARRNESKPGTTEQRKGPENERPLEGGARRSIGGEDHPKDRQVKRPTVKPIPKIGSDSDSDEAHFRPRPRAFRGDDELSESDMNFFKQQFQATNTRREHEKDTSQESPVGCKGMNCYRCSSFIPECEGVCSLCGTLCQRPGGPCKACRDICERCGKPRYRCTSPDERLGTSDEERGENEEHFDTEADETGPGTPEQRTSPFRGHVNSPVSASAEELTRERSLIAEEVNNSDKRYRKSKERKIRAPPERKSKDPNSVKRVRKKRYRTVDEEDNGQLEEKEVVEEEEHGDDHPQSTEPTQVNSGEVVPVQLQPSAFAAKGTKKTKPSKKVISQTIVYKETKRPPMSIQGHSPGREDFNEEDSVVTSPTPLVETVEPGEDLLVQNNDEGTGEEVQMEEKTVEGDGSNDDVTEDGKDVGSKGEEEPPANNEEREKEKEKGEEKEEEKQKEKEKRNVLPKIRGVSRVNAAFKERAELGKRLQNVLKEAVSEVMGQADIRTRKDSTIDYIAQYRLVDRSRLEMYGRAFTLEDEDEDGMISYEQMMLALEGVPSIAGLSRKQLMFVLQVLELFPGSRITFKMFSVATALCEKVTILDAFVKQLVEELDLFELECKLDMFRSMFFVTGDFSVTFITADQLRIELKAGGLNQNQEDHVIGHILQSSNTGEISFLDYMAYLPLFLSIHQNICDNALDMSRNKYQRKSTT
ncbi:DNA ligase 1-like [Stylophora pistillata]|nr:DNA ligase 1-like [Stylophora pistillata]